jgi:excisionase family DNA binding protein
METTPLLTAAEIAEHLGVSPSTVRRLANARTITCVWVGTTPRFDLALVLHELTVEAAPAAPQPDAAPRRKPAPAPRGEAPSAESELDRRRRMKGQLFG